MDKVYFLLYCNFAGSPYEIGFGPESKSRDFFEKFRGHYGYDKYGNAYSNGDEDDCDDIMDMTVLTFKTKEELLSTIAESMGVIIRSGEVKSKEEIQKEKLQRAEEYFNNCKIHNY